jgi:probable rRNA maturation factor
MRLAIETVVDCSGWDELADLDTLIAECLQASVQESGVDLPEGTEVNLLFCDDERIRGLNREFRGQDKPTNVLSFPGALPLGSAHFLGDIAIAYETVAREAREQGKTLDHHCRHMIAHGFLHLLGYDHEDDQNAEVMEAVEIRILRRLGVDNPYGDEEREKTVDHERV